MILHEFIAYGFLRSGVELQWLNILRELTQPNFTWKDLNVYYLFFQAATQVEKRDIQQKNVRRKAHFMFEDDTFCTRLLSVVTVFIRRVKANWNEIHSVAMAVDILLRLCSLSTSDAIQRATLVILREVREFIAADWIVKLVARLFNMQDPIQISKAQHDLIYASCICRRTFDTEAGYIAANFSEPNDLTRFFYCAVLIRDNAPPNLNSLPKNLSRSLLRDQRMAYFLEAHVRAFAMADRSGLDHAIEQVWPSYTPDKEIAVQSLGVPMASRWLSTQTLSGQCVHYDILLGRLLVNGTKLGRLPQDYVLHPTYLRIFGNVCWHCL